MTLTVERCPVCGGTTFEPFERQPEAGRQLVYVLCPNCGMVVQSPRMSDEELAAFYTQGYRLNVQGSETPTDKDLRIQAGRARHLVRLCRRSIRAVRTHLDIGSSSGALVRAVARQYGSAGVGVEPGEPYRQLALSRGTETLAALDDLGESRRGSFELVSLIHVLEHLPEPVEYLRRLRQRWLAPQGHLLVEVPNLFGHRGTELSHLLVFSPGTLRRTLEAAGYRVDSVWSHGVPRSPVLKLYLTALASVGQPPNPGRLPPASSRAMRIRRRLGLWLYDTLTERLPGWTWQELPAPEAEGG